MQHDDGPSSKTWDLIIIGAGIYGIQVARTYLELNPTKQVIVLESGNAIGGVWSRERVYNDFWTQTPIGILEFSDQPIHDIPKEDQYYGFFKAKHVAKYLDDYCSNHVYEGTSLASRIHFETSVTKVHKIEDVWHTETSVGGSRGTSHKSRQLVDASGLTSSPNWPDLRDRDHFHGQMLHHKDFAKWEHSVEKDSKLRIAVLGGAKSAADVAYSCAKAGHQVTWIIRKTGSGPAAFVSAEGSFGYANSNESFYTRFTALFLASRFSVGTGYDRLLGLIHQYSPGQQLLRRIWQRINAKAWKEANYDRPDGQDNGFHNLKPDTELFWQNDSTGINQREDFFDVIARKVKVVREDVSRMCEDGILLFDETVVKADVVICATGWKIAHSYFEHETALRLGLPVQVSAADVSEQHWNDLQDLARNDVLKAFPMLDSPWAQAQRPSTPDRGADLTPFRLWKCMVPLHDPSIIFVGKVMLGNHFRNAEVQALFTCAVLSGKIDIPPLENREQDVARTITWCRRRYPGGKGRYGHWLYWDLIPYTDMLLTEMGLSSHRKTNTLTDLFRPCFAQDLVGLIFELKAKTTHEESEV